MNNVKSHPTFSEEAAFAPYVVVAALRAGSLLSQVLALPASRGYEPFFRKLGTGNVAARGLAHLLKHHAERVGKKRAVEPQVTGALKELARGKTGLLSRRRKARALLKLWNDSTIIETVCDTVDVDVFRFVGLLERFQSGDLRAEVALRRISRAILAKWAPHLGCRATPWSIAHEFLLRELRPTLRFPLYSYREDCCVDAASKATATEFNLSSFDARPAIRRTRKHG